MLREVSSSLFFILAFVLFVTAGIFIVNRLKPQSLAFAEAPLLRQITNPHIPSRISIHSLAKSFSIYPSRIDGGKWETTEKGVSYLATSAMPGEVGNAIFYGHNFPSLLSSLDDVAIGSRIVIEEADGTAKQFTVIEKKVVKPTDVSILQQTKDRRITLYTCTGFLDSQRLVVIATIK